MPIWLYVRLGFAAAVVSFIGLQSCQLRETRMSLVRVQDAATASKERAATLASDLVDSQATAQRERSAVDAAAALLAQAEVNRATAAAALNLALKGHNDATLTTCLNLHLPDSVLRELPQ